MELLRSKPFVLRNGETFLIYSKPHFLRHNALQHFSKDELSVPPLDFQIIFQGYAVFYQILIMERTASLYAKRHCITIPPFAQVLQLVFKMRDQHLFHCVSTINLSAITLSLCFSTNAGSTYPRCLTRTLVLILLGSIKKAIYFTCLHE